MWEKWGSEVDDVSKRSVRVNTEAGRDACFATGKKKNDEAPRRSRVSGLWRFTVR